MLNNHSEYADQKWSDINLKDDSINGSIFEGCHFLQCHFDNSVISQCKFIECTFKACSLDLVKFKGSSFLETDFIDCKMKGINWTEIHFPYVIVTSPIFFNRCDISYSTFYELNLPSIAAIECKAHEVDFRGTNLSNADLICTDFQNAHFHQTILKDADLREAINYRLDPNDNIIKKAKFSLPEAINLLSNFDIEIDNL